MNLDPIIIVFMQSSLWNPDIFDHTKHLAAVKARHAALRHLAHESCLNETSAVIFSCNALRLGSVTQRLKAPYTQTRAQTCTNCSLSLGRVP